MQLMAHQSCKIPDDDENIPQGIVTFDYHLLKHDVDICRYTQYSQKILLPSEN